MRLLCLTSKFSNYALIVPQDEYYMSAMAFIRHFIAVIPAYKSLVKKLPRSLFSRVNDD